MFTAAPEESLFWVAHPQFSTIAPEEFFLVVLFSFPPLFSNP
jgi:hypothetical protein